jgi:SPW repeat
LQVIEEAFMPDPRRSTISWASGLNIALGIWLIISPFVFGYGDMQTLLGNDIILGIVVGALAVIRVLGPFSTSAAGWLNFLLGIWIIISPFALGFSDNNRWNDVAVGAVIAALAAWSTLTAQSAPRSGAQPQSETHAMR